MSRDVVKMKTIFIAVCLMAVLSVASVDALQCWFCVRQDKDFGIKLKENCKIQTCPEGTVCYTEIYKCKRNSPLNSRPNQICFPASGGVQSVKGCTPEEKCQRARAGKLHCRTCKRDLCNAETEKYYVGFG